MVFRLESPAAAVGTAPALSSVPSVRVTISSPFSLMETPEIPTPSSPFTLPRFFSVPSVRVTISSPFSFSLMSAIPTPSAPSLPFAPFLPLAPSLPLIPSLPSLPSAPLTPAALMPVSVVPIHQLPLLPIYGVRPSFPS